MPTPILATKLYIPPPRPMAVLRPRLVERMNESLCANQGSGRKLALISAPAGFGKTTLIIEWVANCERPAAWLSLDEGDSDPARFLAYLVAALQTIAPDVGKGVLGAIQSPQPPPIESILTTLLNEITTFPKDFTLVLDDYHVADSKSVDDAVSFLLEHLPPRMHLVIATREDPQLPLSKLRVHSELVELRAVDLRFTPSEAAEFLNRVMRLNLSAQDITALETRTEGWIAGLQLAAISMQGHQDTADFINTFTGSHRFVMDYLVEQVLQQQSETVQNFLLRTSILDRMCSPLCDAVLRDASGSGQATLEYLERANLFLVPLDDNRRWYRYHHLFSDLLRRRLLEQLQKNIASSSGDDMKSIAELHVRASQWYEDSGFEIEAFHHAVVANDVERAARLVEGKGMPLQFRGALTPVLQWLEALPAAELDARPLLWVMYASALSMTGQVTGVEEKLQAAEAALRGAEPDAKSRNLIGHIAAIRAVVAAAENQVETIITQSRRALEYLHPDNLAVRTATIWKLGIAYQLQGDRAAAGRAYSEARSISQASGNFIINMGATIGLGNIQETENQLSLAEQSYLLVLKLVGDGQNPAACEAHLGLARISYEWNDLDAAEQHRREGAVLARQIGNTERIVTSDILLARIKLATGDVTGAAATLADVDQVMRQHNIGYRMAEVVAAQMSTLLRQDNLEAAAHLAQTHDLPIGQARVYLARGDASSALAVLEPLRQQLEAKGWQDERLKVMVVQAVALDAHGEKDKAVQVLGDALALAEPGGFIRLFVDEGAPMAQLLSVVANHEIRPDYVVKLIAAFGNQKDVHSSSPAPGSLSHVSEQGTARSSPHPLLVEHLTERELGILRLIAQGLSNQEIGERLFLALSTVKGHNREIFDKLQVQNRTEAVARARELGLL